jgi:hypothetical protein
MKVGRRWELARVAAFVAGQAEGPTGVVMVRERYHSGTIHEATCLPDSRQPLIAELQR